MPVVGGSSGGKKKNQHHSGGLFGSLGHAFHDVTHVVSGTSKGVYHGVTGFPTGLYMTGRALGHDVMHTRNLHDLHKSRTGSLLKGIAQAEYDSYRHFGKGGDVSGPLFDALALLSAGGGAAARVGAGVSRASKAEDVSRVAEFARGVKAKPQYTRKAKYMGEVRASPNPAFRAGRSIREAGRGKLPVAGSKTKKISISDAKTVTIRGSHQRAALTELGHRARRLDQIRQSLDRPLSYKQRALPAEKTVTSVGHLVNAPMNLLRATMVMRPRYMIQNVFQTATALGIHPVAAMKAAKMLHDHPNLRAMSEGAVGSGIAKSMESELAKGKVSKGVGVMFHVANYPEAKLRAISVPVQFMKHGVNNPAEMERMIEKALKEGIVGTKETQMTHRILKNAEEEVGAFARQTPNERAFMRTQIPIFYPMFKALLRYGYRMPSEHSIVSAAGLATGKAGKAEQKRLLGPLPFWAQYLIPKGAGNPQAVRGPKEAVFNPANLYNIQPAADLSQQAAEGFRHGGPRPGVNFLQEVGPLPQILFAASQAKDLQTGYPLITKNTPNWMRSAYSQALVNYFAGLPAADVGRTTFGLGTPHLKSYEQTSGTRGWALQGFGPGFVSRKLKTKETTKQAKSEATLGKTHHRRHRKRHYKDSP